MKEPEDVWPYGSEFAATEKCAEIFTMFTPEQVNRIIVHVENWHRQYWRERELKDEQE